MEQVAEEERPRGSAFAEAPIKACWFFQVEPLLHHVDNRWRNSRFPRAAARASAGRSRTKEEFARDGFGQAAREPGLAAAERTGDAW